MDDRFVPRFCRMGGFTSSPWRCSDRPVLFRPMANHATTSERDTRPKATSAPCRVRLKGLKTCRSKTNISYAYLYVYTPIPIAYTYVYIYMYIYVYLCIFIYVYLCIIMYNYVYVANDACDAAWVDRRTYVYCIGICVWCVLNYTR